MGLTERHWFENEELKLTDRQLEDIVYENKKAYNNGYVKGFRDARTLEKYLVEFGVKIGFLTPEKAEQLLKEHPQIVQCPPYMCGDCLCRVCARNECGDNYAKGVDNNCLGCNGCKGTVDLLEDCPKEAFVPDEE